MASTLTPPVKEQMCGRQMSFWQASANENGVQENHPHGLSEGVVVESVSFELVSPPLDGSIVQMDHDRDGDSLTNDTVRLRFSSAGSLQGAVVRICARSAEVASGGVTLHDPL